MEKIIPLICGVLMILPQVTNALQVDELAVNGNTINLEENKVESINTSADIAVSGTLVLRTNGPATLQSDLTEFHAATKDGQIIGNVFEPSGSYPAVIQFTGITPSARTYTVLSVSNPQDYYVLIGLEYEKTTPIPKETTPALPSSPTLLDGFDKFVASSKTDDTRIPLERQILQELLNENKTDAAVSLAQVYMAQITNESNDAQTKAEQCNNARMSLEQAKNHFGSLPVSLQKDLSVEINQAEQELNIGNCGASLVDSEKISSVQPSIFDSIRDQVPYIILVAVAIPGIVVVRKIRGGGMKV